MSTPPPRAALRVRRQEEDDAPRERRRAVWRQRLIDAEGGYRHGLRGSSVLYAHLFAASLAIVSCGVLGASFADWLLLSLALAAVIIAELFHAAVQTLAAALRAEAPETARQATRLSTAAALTAVVAALAAALAIIGQHVVRLFA